MTAPTGLFCLPSAERTGGFSPGRTLGPVVGTAAELELDGAALLDIVTALDDGAETLVAGGLLGAPPPEPEVHALTNAATAAKAAHARIRIRRSCHELRSCARLSTGPQRSGREVVHALAGRHAGGDLHTLPTTVAPTTQPPLTTADNS